MKIINSHFFPAQGGSTLLDGLVAAWLLDEIEGTRVDQVSGLDLAETNGVPFGAGKVSPVCANFAVANDEYLSIADTPDLSIGANKAFTVACWVNQLDVLVQSYHFMTKASWLASYKGEFTLMYHSAAQGFVFIVYESTDTYGAQSGAILTPKGGLWYLVIGTWDPATRTANCYANEYGSYPATLPEGYTANDADAAFNIGKFPGWNWMNGRIDQAFFWDRILTADERAELYALGRGNPYPFGEATGYNRPGGTGDRTYDVILSSNVFDNNSALFYLVYGGFANQRYFNYGTLDSSAYVKFDFGCPKVVDGGRMYQTADQNQGTWKWQGSNNDSTWTDIGSSFTISTKVHSFTTLGANATAYRYYRMVGVSGSTNGGPYCQGFCFKVGDVTYDSVSTTGLVAWWDLANSLTDQHASYDVTALGGASYKTDRWGDASGSLEGYDTVYAAYATTDASFDPDTALSVVFWMKEHWNSPDGTEYFLRLFSGGSSSFYVWKQRGTNNRIGLAITAAGGSASDNTAVHEWPIADMGWHHCAITWDGSDSGRVCIYVDGKCAYNATTSATGAFTGYGAGKFGINAFSDSVNEAVTCLMARVSWWHRALTKEEVLQLYNAGDDVKYADL